MHTIINTSNKNAMASIIPMNHPAVATFSFGFMMMLSACKNKQIFENHSQSNQEHQGNIVPVLS
jgi:hypothetical protein